MNVFNEVLMPLDTAARLTEVFYVDFYSAKLKFYPNVSKNNYSIFDFIGWNYKTLLKVVKETKSLENYDIVLALIYSLELSAAVCECNSGRFASALQAFYEDETTNNNILKYPSSINDEENYRLEKLLFYLYLLNYNQSKRKLYEIQREYFCSTYQPVEILLLDKTNPTVKEFLKERVKIAPYENVDMLVENEFEATNKKSIKSFIYTNDSFWFGKEYPQLETNKDFTISQLRVYLQSTFKESNRKKLENVLKEIHEKMISYYGASVFDVVEGLPEYFQTAALVAVL